MENQREFDDALTISLLHPTEKVSLGNSTLRISVTRSNDKRKRFIQLSSVSGNSLVVPHSGNILGRLWRTLRGDSRTH